MTNYVIYGTTDLSRQLHYYVEDDNQGSILAFVLDRQYIKTDEFDGLPVIAYDVLDSYFGKRDIEVLVSLGYSKMNDNRKAIFDKCKSDGWKIGSFIHSSTQNLADKIGDGNIILDHVDIHLHSFIGEGNVIGTHTSFGHDNYVGNFNWFSGGSSTAGRVNIGDNNFIGKNSIIENSCTIENYDLIGAGVCLNRSIESETVVAPTQIRTEQVDKRVMDLFLMKKFS